MRDIKQMNEIVQKSAQMFEKWDSTDRYIFLGAFSAFADVCDAINRKYDGRDERMKILLEKLMK